MRTATVTACSAMNMAPRWAAGAASSGVFPSAFTASVGAPAATSVLATVTLPSLQARCKGVLPSVPAA